VIGRLFVGAAAETVHASSVTRRQIVLFTGEMYETGAEMFSYACS
jgi:hypothetical protein